MAHNFKTTKAKEENKKKLRIILVALFVICILFAAYIFYFQNSTKLVEEMDMYLIVGGKIGFDLSPDYLHFGRVMPGASSKKEVIVSNINAEPLKVNLEASGNFSRWINLSENNFVLPEYGNKSIEITVNVPLDAEYGNYTGKLLTVFRRAQ